MDVLPTIFGEDFLRYVLAQEDLHLTGPSLSSSQLAVTRTLTDLALHLQAQPADVREIGLVNAILAYVHREETSLANTWRRQCGGALITPAGSSDPFLSNLTTLARDTYPAFLLPREQGNLGASLLAISGPVIRHPEWKQICHAALSDNALGALFPIPHGTADSDQADELREISSVLTLSYGRTTRLQLALLPDTLMAAAYLRYLLCALPHTPETYASCIETVVEEIRHLATKQTADVPLIYGISNVESPPGTDVEVPWGSFRSPNPIDSIFIPQAVQVGAIFQTTGTISILAVDEFHSEASHLASAWPQKHQRSLDRWAQQADRKSDLMRLAVLLASPHEGFLVAHQASRTILDPLQSSPTMRWTAIGLGSPGMAAIPISELGQEAPGRLQKWAKKTNDHPANLDIAMRRTLSAIGERMDPLDGFIDSVLAWENLFSGRPETNLRVCGAIAWLLEPRSYDRRSQLSNELSKLYAARSSLVHGSSAIVDNAAGARDRAVQITLECFRRLYQHPNLLHAKDSSTRGRMLLMGSTTDPDD